VAERWPPKPRSDERCDTTSCLVPADPGQQPLVERCPNLAVETAIGVLGIQTYLCTPCADALEAKGTILRNPNRKIRP
jgi:hypothetical protein